MLRILFFLILVLLLGFGFAWVADRPGDVTLEWQGQQYQTSLMVLVAAIVVVVAAIMFVWWIVSTILNSPRIMARFMRKRKRERGYNALSKGLIAAGSGDAASARRYTKESTKLLDGEPLTGLLDAQTSLLEGNRDAARERFEKMLKDDDTRLLALRGLYLEAEKQGAREAARQYVEEAVRLEPSLPWAGNAMLRYRATEGDWEGALRALDSNRAAGLLDKEQAKRQRAVLLTAQAMASEQTDPSSAAKLAREAKKLAPDLVPAAIIGAKALMRGNDLRRAASLLESVWKKEPHPEIADAYVHLRIGDSALDRLKRAKKLAAMKPNHPEGSIAIAEAAIEAQEWETAREAMVSVMNNRPTERACLIMADLEEAEFGDKGRMRDWLSRAVRAPKDAAWTAEGYVSEKWLPFSPVSGKIDAFEWKVPVEQLDGSNALENEDLDALVTLRPEENSANAANAAATSAVTGVAVGAAIEEVIEDAQEAEPAETIEPAIDTPKSHDNTAAMEEGEDILGDVKNADSAMDEGKADMGKDNAGDDGEKDDAGYKEVKFPLDHRPDDPGVREDAEKPKKRFGLF